MIVEYVRYIIAEPERRAFVEAVTKACAVLQRNPHCLSYELAQNEAHSTKFGLRVVWDGPTAQQDFRADPTFGSYLVLLAPYAASALSVSTQKPLISSPMLPEKGVPSLYEWAGGRPALRRLLDRFYDLVEEDVGLARFFPRGVSEEHRAHVTTWWCEVFGGPAGYSAMGGYPRMLAHHLNLHITAEQRRQFVTLLSQAADLADLPDDPEFRAALMSYAEWGTWLALHNSQQHANVVREAPMPRWGWGVAPPYLG